MKKYDIDIETLLGDYKAATENIQIPAGHQERFAYKLNEHSSAKKTIWERILSYLHDPTAGKRSAWILAPALGVITIALCLNHLNKNLYINQIESNYLYAIKEYGKQLSEEGQALTKEDRQDILYSISSILSEEERLALQLPADMPKKEKQKILKEYYNQKMEGLNRIKIFIAHNKEEQE